MENSVKPGLRLIDRLLLVGAWLLSCSAVYALGFYTGSQIQERVPDDEERIVRLPVTADPPESGQHAKTGEDFTFYDTLVPGPSRPRAGDAVTVERAAADPAAGGKSDSSRNHAPHAPATKGATRTPAKVTPRAGRPAGSATRTAGTTRAAAAMTAAKVSTRDPGGTVASRSRPHAANAGPKSAPSKAKQPPATRAAAAGPSKRSTPGPSPGARRARTAATSTDERPAARPSHPHDGVARSAVASE